MADYEVADTLTHLDFASARLSNALREMAISGAPADALREITDDLMQVRRWRRQTVSTMDDGLVRKTAMRWLKMHEVDPKRCSPKSIKRGGLNSAKPINGSVG